MKKKGVEISVTSSNPECLLLGSLLHTFHPVLWGSLEDYNCAHHFCPSTEDGPFALPTQTNYGKVLSLH